MQLFHATLTNLPPAAGRDMGPRSMPEGRDTDRSSPRPRGDGEEQEEAFQVAAKRTIRK